jgi:hypothetical protein
VQAACEPTDLRAKDLAFLISISGAGVPAAETTIDQARNDMTMTGMPPQTLEAKAASNAEMKSLQRFVPGYFTTIQDWLAKRIRGFARPPIAIYLSSPSSSM